MFPIIHRGTARLVGPGACFLALGLLAAPTPAAAQSSDFKGWLAALDVALTENDGHDNHIATVSDGNLFPPRTERIVLDSDSDVSWRGAVGYDFGLDLGRVQVSYWTFENDNSENFSRTGFVAPSLFGYGFYGYMLMCNTYYGTCDSTLPVVFSGGSSVKASTWDLDYSRTVEMGDRVSLKWLAGLRTARFEQEQSFEGFEGTYTYRQARSWDADAFGIRVGAAGNFNFTEHFRLGAGASWSQLQAETVGRSSQTFVDGGFACGFPPCTEISVGRDDGLHGSILDLELKGVWSAGPVDISLGFSSSTWDGFVGNPVPANGFLFTSESSTQESVGFTSFEVGVLWRIGGSRRVFSP